MSPFIKFWMLINHIDKLLWYLLLTQEFKPTEDQKCFISSSVVTLCLSSTVHIIWNFPSVCVLFHPPPSLPMTHVLCGNIAFSHALSYSVLEKTHNWVSHILVQVRWLYFSRLTLPNWACSSLCLGKWLKIPSEVCTVIFVEQSSLTWDCCHSESHKRLRYVWKLCLYGSCAVCCISVPWSWVSDQPDTVWKFWMNSECVGYQVQVNLESVCFCWLPCFWWQ